MGIGRVAMVAFWTVLATASGADGRELKITVRLYDYAHLSKGILLKAGSEAQRIFRKAGIETEWVECPLNRGAEAAYSACNTPLTPADVTVRVVPPSMEGYPIPPGAFGFALQDGDGRAATHSYVFYHRVEEATRQCNGSLFTVLGYVMAHEIGHLLLGAKEHSSSGIMCLRWSKAELAEAEKGRLKFSREQALRMQARVRTRLEAR